MQPIAIAFDGFDLPDQNALLKNAPDAGGCDILSDRNFGIQSQVFHLKLVRPDAGNDPLSPAGRGQRTHAGAAVARWHEGKAKEFDGRIGGV